MVNSARKCSSSAPSPLAGCVSSLSTGGRSLSASLRNLASSASCNERAAVDFNADAPSEHADEGIARLTKTSRNLSRPDRLCYYWPQGIPHAEQKRLRESLRQIEIRL